MYSRRAVCARLSYISLKKRGFQTWHPRPSYSLSRGKTSDRRLLDPWLTSTPLSSEEPCFFICIVGKPAPPIFRFLVFSPFLFPSPTPSYSSPPVQFFSPFRFLVPSFFVFSISPSHSALGNVNKDGGMFQIVRVIILIKFLLEEENVTGWGCYFYQWRRYCL